MTCATSSNVGFQYIDNTIHVSIHLSLLSIFHSFHIPLSLSHMIVRYTHFPYVPDSFTELLSEGVGIADMKWGVIKELQQQRENSEPSTGSEELSTVKTADDLLSMYNTIVYGLPHLTLNLPA